MNRLANDEGWERYLATARPSRRLEGLPRGTDGPNRERPRPRRPTIPVPDRGSDRLARHPDSHLQMARDRLEPRLAAGALKERRE